MNNILSFAKNTLCVAALFFAASMGYAQTGSVDDMGWDDEDPYQALRIYYAQTGGKQKEALKSAVKSCAASHSTLSYSNLFQYYDDIDIVPGTTNQVFDYYSTVVAYYSGNGNAVSGFNKEHSCPQSWWGGGSSSDCYSDLFNVLPSEQNANSAKSNYPVGEVGNATFSNGRIKVGPAKAGSLYTDKVFEPADEHKGDFARIYFYVATIYAQANWGSKSSVAATCAFVKQDYPTIKNEFIQLLLKWHRQDPVDNWEITRNERVYGVQHNRNPYIDFPQLAEYIWGDSTGFTFDINTAIPHLDLSGLLGGNPGGGGDNPGGGGGGTNPDTPVGTKLFSCTFEDTEGSNNSTGGSSTLWSGDDHFPNTTTVYQAGNAVRLGSSKNSGSMTSCPLAFNGGDVVVKISAKGWSDGGAHISVAVSGAASQTANVTHELSDGFETVALTFRGVSANPTLTIATSGSPIERFFVDWVEVYVAANTNEIIEMNVSEDSCDRVVDLFGRCVEKTNKGAFFVKNGKKVTFR